MRKQTSLAEKQYQRLGKVFEPNKKKEDKRKNKRICAMSNLFYSKGFIFNKYCNPKEFATKRSFDSKQSDLREFKDILLFFCQYIEKLKLNNEKDKCSK